MINYTFIIPHHNNPELLERCLNSIPCREDIQIVVIDDNSDSDKAPNIARKDVELLSVDAYHTKGAGHARNVGLEKAKGKWLLFADCDDYYVPNFLDVLDKYRESNLDVLYFSYNFIDAETNVLLDHGDLRRHIEGQLIDKKSIYFIKYRNNMPWTKMVRRDFVSEHNLYFEEVENGNDMLFSILTGYCCEKYNVIGDRIYNYIQTKDSITTKIRTISAHLCKLRHIYLRNNFYESIGCPELKLSVIRYILSVIKYNNIYFSLKFIYKVLCATNAMLKEKNLLIDECARCMSSKKK